MLTNSIWGDVKYQFRHGNIAVKLIFANVGIFLLVALFKLVCTVGQFPELYTQVVLKLQVPANLSILLHQPWTIFTYMFLHEGLLHILFNMLWLYWFSEIVILFLGDKRILTLYLVGGLAGAAIYIAAYNLIPYFRNQADVSYMAGASAGVLAIVWGAVALSPNYEVRLFIFGDVKIKYIALVSIVLDIINIPYGNAGGYIAHIGGAVAGYLCIKGLQNGIDIAGPFKKIRNLFVRSSAVKMVHRNDEQAVRDKHKRTDSEQKRIDDILDKISRSGYDSLSKEEKDFLFHFSNKQ